MTSFFNKKRMKIFYVKLCQDYSVLFLDMTDNLDVGFQTSRLPAEASRGARYFAPDPFRPPSQSFSGSHEIPDQ